MYIFFEKYQGMGLFGKMPKSGSMCKKHKELVPSMVKFKQRFFSAGYLKIQRVGLDLVFGVFWNFLEMDDLFFIIFNNFNEGPILWIF